MKLFLIFLFIVCLLLEGTVTTLPLVLLFLLCLIIVKRDASVFAIAFFSGLLLDLLTLQTLGVSSLFFVSFMFLILLYQGKYEIHSYPFVLVSSFLGSFGFLFLFGYGSGFKGALISAVLAVFGFGIMTFIQKSKGKIQNYK